MSRIGRKPVVIPAGVEVTLDGNTVTVKGPKGTLTRTFHNRMNIAVENNEIVVTRPSDDKEDRSLVMVLGYSHKVVMPEIENISIEVPGPNKIIISGPDKQVVGQFAAKVREKRKPEPYKGKGIKYVDEVIIRKEGKAGKGK